MSCIIKTIANIVDVDSVRRCLFPTDDLRGTESWLHNCIISISPTGELAALARDQKLVILNAKWDSNTTTNNFHITFSGVLDCTDIITSVLCLPIVATGQNSQVGPDWTCIVIGFASGHVKFYTENCSLLASEQLHDDRVCCIKAQSHRQGRPDRGVETYPEEVYVMYPTNICVVAGNNLIQSLRNCRAELARVQAKGESLEPTPLSLFPKKWGFSDQTVVHDCAAVGLDVANTFDHLLTASTCGGFNTKYRAVAPHTTLMIGVGAKPYVAFQYAIEGGTQPVLSDVAKAVASKLKSALPGWLTGTKNQSAEKPPPVVVMPPEPMTCRFGLVDHRRIADNIILSPEKTLAVVSDSLGRVALIDTRKGHCLRLWKGYREAECAFLQVYEDSRIKHPRTEHKIHRVALFLVIFAPKKGIIEIWAMQQGPKIATFTASKNGRLLYTTHGLMGLGSAIQRSRHSNFQFMCSLLDPDGQIKEIIVPFHFALSDKNSKRARDVHLVKRLKQFLKTNDYNPEKLCTEIGNTCNELKTNEIRMQCLDMLLSNKSIQPAPVIQAARLFLEKLSTEDDCDNELHLLLSLCRNVCLITEYFMYIVGINDEIMDAENGNMDVDIENDNIEKPCDGHRTDLLIGQRELNNLQRLLDLSTMNDNREMSHAKVSFKEEKRAIFVDYLSAFNLKHSENSITLKSDFPDEKLYRISEVMFLPYITSGVNGLGNFENRSSKSKIQTLDLLRLVLAVWIQRPLTANINLENEMYMLSKLISAICKTENIDLCVPYNEISPFWKKVRDILAMSPRPFQALTAAILCRGVAQKIERENELQQSQCSANSLEEELNTDIWEKLSQDNCQWSILIGKLEDVSLLNIILANKIEIENAVLPKLNYEKFEISLKYILQKGKGSVSELVAKWLSATGINPETIVENDMLPHPEDNNQQESSSKPESIDVEKIYRTSPSDDNIQVENSLCDQLNMLKKQFPYSLQTSILLANMCWEYAMAWQKDLQNFQCLKAALTCIQNIPNAYIKQGMCTLMWTTHMKQTLESTSKLLNKVGKLPKERLCRQDTGLSDIQVTEFLGVCSQFFYTFMHAVSQTHDCDRKTFHYEDLWDNGGVPLTELALQHLEFNIDLLHLHYELSLSLEMLTSLNIKHSKPVLNLFENICISLFFKEFWSKCEIPTHTSDPKLLSSRQSFLMKAIASSVESVRQENNITYSKEHLQWMSKCTTLATAWGIRQDVMRGHQIVQLFTNGFDILASDLLSTMVDESTIGTALLAVAGRRLHQYIVSAPDVANKMVALTPLLTRYLETLNETSEPCAPSTIDGIITVASFANRCLIENQQEKRLASLLLESCIALKEQS